MNETEYEKQKQELETALWHVLTQKEVRHIRRVLHALLQIHESVRRMEVAWERAARGGNEADLAAAREAEDKVLKWQFKRLGWKTDRQ